MDTSSFLTEGYIPPTAFYFEVVFIGNGNSKMDSSFQEVSGLKVTVETMVKKESEDNIFVHHLPKSIKYDNLVLKRCLMKGSELEKWCRDAIENFEFKPLDIKLSLLSFNSEGVGSHIPIQLAAWSIEKAYPISWELAPTGSGKNEFTIETLTLKYRKFSKTF
ncbi:phage tail protein [Aquiflexum sp. LQ15W]|uniref:phage tail protein n=1 Tax=Cognataquiflexum nitidum TaxID=2922272 RepID=UPI001F136AFF|nr:phage tail protein [Cognataquiflexum nitidum]MCH6200581.1 phage tail protein [Cognataquiflexum nitidum]